VLLLLWRKIKPLSLKFYSQQWAKLILQNPKVSTATSSKSIKQKKLHPNSLMTGLSIKS